MTVLTQISKHEGVIKRVKPGDTPVIELHLQEGQYVANVELEKKFAGAYSERKTDDWTWTAYIVTPLP